jgi:lipoprotein-anchoring transpeptidase ErfK/SrfK
MKPTISFTRRDFLKLSAAGALGMFLTDTGLDRALALAEPPASHGRVLMSGLFMYEVPSFGSESWKAFGKDQVVPISEVVEGEAGNPYNTAWYHIGDEGYTYSGWVQPVETVYNQPVFDIRAEGQVGEVTVPFTLARPEPNVLFNGRRYYYQTTHWIKRTVVNRAQKSIWYEVYDFHEHKSYYIPTYDLRVVPDEELTPLSPQVPDDQKHIQVDLATQTVTAFEGDAPVLIARCSSGAGDTKTPTGDFRTYHKGPSIHMSNEGDDEAGVYDLPGVPWVSFFTGTGVSFHGTYWHNDYGRPRSHGCVNLRSMDAKFIYRWTNPVIPPGVDYLHLPGQGTAVQVSKS